MPSRPVAALAKRGAEFVKHHRMLADEALLRVIRRYTKRVRHFKQILNVRFESCAGSQFPSDYIAL